MTGTNTRNGSTFTGLLSGVWADGRQLFAEQAEMVKAEVKENLGRTKIAAAFAAAGVVLALIGFVFLLVAAALGLQAVMPPWAAWLTVGGAVAVLGVVLLICAKLHLPDGPLPTRSFRAFQENLTWLLNHRN